MPISGINPSSGGGYNSDSGTISEMQGTINTVQNEIEEAPMDQQHLNPQQLLAQFNQFKNSLDNAMKLFSDCKSSLSPKDQSSISESLTSIQNITELGSDPAQEAQNYSKFISNFQDSDPTAVYAVQLLQSVSQTLAKYTS